MKAKFALWLLACLAMPTTVLADPLVDSIDRAIRTRAGSLPISGPASDAEFLRRVTLDFTGRIPTPAEVRAFVADTTADKRVRTIDRLMASPEYAPRMASAFHVMFMERLGEHKGWSAYLQSAFRDNRPWDQMARDMLRGQAESAQQQGAVYFLAKRLENYGQVPVDYPALTRDVGRLFLGVDLRCAECHDHLFIKDYHQQDFAGLSAFFKQVSLLDPALPAVQEKPTIEKLGFMSVFKKVPHQTGPRVPGLTEIAIPAQVKGKEYRTPPDAKTKSPGRLQFSPLERLAEDLPTAKNPQFARNFVNRMWWLLLGRGLVHPLDLHHDANPASHPEVLSQLTDAFIAHKFDIRWLLRTIALTEAYQRSSELPVGAMASPPEKFITALEKRLSSEQLFVSVLIALGEKDRLTQPAMAKEFENLQTRFVKAFANQPREPEDEITPALRSALFVANDPRLLDLIVERPGNLLTRLSAIPNDRISELGDEMLLSILGRSPDADERKLVAQQLASSTGVARTQAITRLVWALLATTEFSVNH